MSEKYFNAYVDAAVGLIHEYVASTLQLKAQVRVANDLIAEKDTAIANLQNEVTALRNQTSENDVLRSNAKHWEDSYHAMSNKVSHMETLTNQYNDLKRQFLDQGTEWEKTKQELEKANQRIAELENPVKISKKVINTKNISSNTKAIVAETKSEEKEVDDF